MRFDDATALAGLIAERQVSAKEVLETAIARAEQNQSVDQRHRAQAVRSGAGGGQPGRRAARSAACPTSSKI